VDELVEVPTRVFERQRVGVNELLRNEEMKLRRKVQESWAGRSNQFLVGIASGAPDCFVGNPYPDSPPEA
jgi:hypothetical protein